MNLKQERLASDSQARLRPNLAPTPAPINGARAYGYLNQITELGPRPAGSAANTLQRQLVTQQFARNGAVVREQPFTGVDPLSGAKVEMANLVGSWHPERTERVVIAAHYDTRPFPDRETDPNLRQVPYLGANDGASGVALLMELANQLENLPTTVGVDLVLFDGEELVYNEKGEYFLGSKEFVRDYHEGIEQGTNTDRYKSAIVLDMVGGKNLQIKKEPYSLQQAPTLVQDVWKVARRLKVSAFRNNVGRAVLDDHVALSNGGIPAIDVIDFDYPYWHKAQDRPENCSPASLRQVGRVVTGWLAKN
ncbi:M28 family peptidase [Singulisphaera sp. GP187]|uniref:M28 family peptidase n=1 Tax=Singulisphaera sp. GP187 TaxID=1882752 RepID=UPI0009F9BA49|nr:M28 family peptidase [Singulisphaera sp. GP187]